MTQPSAASLSIFNNLFASVAEEMGVTLERAAYSPNIKERLDFSCALFLADGRMLAQAAHIPVHLGAMPASVQAAVDQCAPFADGDVVIVNDPYQGGNHLPDITIVSPVFLGSLKQEEVAIEQDAAKPDFFVASRAHHADVGGMSPGSMPLSTEIYQEGIIIPPIKLVSAGERNEAVWQLILRNVRTPEERSGDLAAQLAAHVTGAKRLHEIVRRYGRETAVAQAEALIQYAQKLTEAAIRAMPDGRYQFMDYLDDDGQADSELVPVQATVTIEGARMKVDFDGTAAAVSGNINAVPAIVRSAVAYCVRCVALALLKTDCPMNAGAFTPIAVTIPAGSLLDPHPPHAVAAGNVETSQRITDVVFGALAKALPSLVPAASQGTMNNLTFGGTESSTDSEAPSAFVYYETIGGGAGAGPDNDGASGVHVHMSNTLNTPVEALEYQFPIRVEAYCLRKDSGGAGHNLGGEGLERRIRFLVPATVTVMSERRRRPPYGLQGGLPGKPGRNSAVRGEDTEELPGKFTRPVNAGDLIVVKTPGGGGWGEVSTK